MHRQVRHRVLEEVDAPRARLVEAVGVDVVHLHGHARAELLGDADRELILRRRLVIVGDHDDVARQVLAP